MGSKRRRAAVLGGVLLVGLQGAAWAQIAAASRPAADSAVAAEARELVARGARYLLAAQDKSGGWAPESGPGISALCVKALALAPDVGPRHAAVRRGVEFVLKNRRDDGGVYSAEGLLKSYETSVTLSMLAALDEPEQQATIAALQKFLKDNQWDEGEGKSLDDPWYGGAGYGRGKRPDLSNTQMMLEALRDSGLPPDDPTYKKALVFIARCQMRGETNDQPFARGATDGGFIYSPAGGGESKAVTSAPASQAGAASKPTAAATAPSAPPLVPTELRTYGTMTYAGFKSMLYAGLTPDDPKVRAALDWIRGHWTLEFNPNMPDRQSREGLFYYYHVFARALAALGEPRIVDQAGRAHDWRAELVAQLKQLQKDDGSWVNPTDRWMEGQPALTTAYSLLALEAAFPGGGK